MSGNGSGGVPREVYQRRRIAAGILGLVVLFLIAKIILGIISGSSSNGSSDPGTDATQLPTAAASLQPTEVPSSDALPSQAPSVMPQVPVAQGYCADSDLSIKVALDRKSTPVGSGLHLSMSVKNISGQSCKRDLGSGANEVTVISGPALIWSTDHCNPSTAKDVVQLAPGQTWSIKVVWTGNLSGKGCKILRAAKSGTYWGHARNGTLNSDGARFVITK